jgi:hypothetical protein
VFPRATPAEPQQGEYDPSVIGSAESRTFATFAAMLAALGIQAAVA